MAFLKKLMDPLVRTVNLIGQIKILQQLSQFSDTHEVIIALFLISSFKINYS